MSRLVRFDWAMKHLLRNKVNFDVLEGFLSELLQMPIKIEKILESESNKTSAEDKFNRVDLLAVTSAEKQILIEVQCNSEADYLSRLLYASSKVICEYLKAGDKYHNVPKVISVSIVFFDIGEGDDYIYRGTTSFKGIHCHDTLKLNQREKELYAGLNPSDRDSVDVIYPEYYIIKVPAFRQVVKDKIDEWVYFLKNGKIEKEFSAQGIQSASQKLDILTLDEKARRTYEAYQELLHSDASFVAEQELNLKMARKKGLAEGRAEGLAEGLEQGLEQGIHLGAEKTSKKIARKLLKTGLSLENIANLTGVPVSVLEKMQALKEGS